MTVRAPVTAERRRLPALGASVAIAVIVLLAAACGSETEESSEPQAGSSAPAPVPAAGAPPAALGGSDGSPAGDGSSPAPSSDVSSQPLVPSPPGASPQPAADGESPPSARQVDTSSMRTFPSTAVWAALRDCESQGDYGFVHPSGQYSGAYQFTVATWDRLAGQRYTDLLGVLPSDAAPGDQDRMAYYLWVESGSAPWPACSRVFSEDPPPPPATAGDTAPEGTTPAPPATEESVAAGTAPAASTSAEDQTSPAEAEADPGGAPERIDEVSGSPPNEDASAPPDSGSDGGGPTPPEELPQLEIDPSVQPAIPPGTPGFPTPDQWAALRHCESRGNYRAVNSTGRFFGAYQFWPDTWDSVAKRHYPRLVGVLPSAATPQDQDRMAYALYTERGAQPWPVCGRYLAAATEAGSSG